jgi:hypothetical protein
VVASSTVMRLIPGAEGIVSDGSVGLASTVEAIANPVQSLEAMQENAERTIVGTLKGDRGAASDLFTFSAGMAAGGLGARTALRSPAGKVNVVAEGMEGPQNAMVVSRAAGAADDAAVLARAEGAVDNAAASEIREAGVGAARHHWHGYKVHLTI